MEFYGILKENSSNRHLVAAVVCGGPTCSWIYQVPVKPGARAHVFRACLGGSEQ